MASTTTRNFPPIIGYQIRNKIGEGGFSTVYRAIHFEKRLTAACKVVLVTKDTAKGNLHKELYKEIKVHSQLKHVNILDFMASETVADDENAAAQNIVPAVYMLLEIAAGGDLFDKIVPDVGMPPNVAHFYFSQLVSGLEFIHTKGVCHRDLKPENIMLNINGILKICDFGLCAVYKHKGMERLLTERCGSLPYVAPELNGDQPYKAEAIDVWGCGVILFALLVGNTPWDEPTDSSPEYVAFLSGQIFQYSPWDRITGGTLEFLLRLLTPNPANRITIQGIKSEPWFSQPNSLTGADDLALARALSAPLHQTGDMDFVNPPQVPPPGGGDGPLTSQDQAENEDDDTPMVTATHASQFTQNLMLFSQTQGGTRYTPGLTRFYTGYNVPPRDILTCMVPFLQSIHVKCRQPEVIPFSDSGSGLSAQDNVKLIMKVAVKDTRHANQLLKGAIEIEPFGQGCFVVMQRLEGPVLGWRRLWKTLVTSPAVGPYVLRKREH